MTTVRTDDVVAGAAHQRTELIGPLLGALATTRAAVRFVVDDSASEASSTNAARADGEPRALVLTKVLGEACLLLRAVDAVVHLDDALTVEAAALTVELVASIAGSDLLVALAEDPAHALSRGFSYLHLRDLGHGDPVIDTVLDGARRLGPAGSEECVPTRALEQLWLERLWSGGSQVSKQERALLAQSLLGRPLDVLGCTELELYALTHLVLYTSDSGRRPPVLPRPRSAVLADATSALALALDADSLDLTAETLWAWPMLAAPSTPPARFALQLLLDTRERHGFLPGPGYRVAEHQSRPSGERERYRLETSYHADLVLGILCAAVLRDRRAARSRRPPGQPDVWAATSAADALLAQLDGPRDPLWVRTVRALPPIERGPLTPLLLTAALRRAAAGHDLIAVQALLRTARTHGLLDLPAAHQAVALLGRGLLLDRALGGAGATSTGGC